MPHISIKMLTGRTKEQKQHAADAVSKALQSALNMGDGHITVSVEDYTAEEWQDVFKSEITDKPQSLYIDAKYNPKDLL